MDLIKEILFMHEGEADLEADKVLRLSPFFYHRTGGEVSLGSSLTAKFSTLGASSYLDSPEEYVEKAAEINPIIDSEFSHLVSAAKGILGFIFDREVVELKGAARMGFHIFDSRANGEEAEWHIDMPFENGGIPWEEPPTEPLSVFSFTVPLRLPRGVGGLDFKEADGAERYLPYTVGNLYLSDGLFPHRIANPIQIRDGEHRVTLQGHGVFSSVSDRAFVYF